LQAALRELVAGALDVNGASPRRYFFEVLRHFAAGEAEVERLEYFASPEGRDDLFRYNQREGAAAAPRVAAIINWKLSLSFLQHLCRKTRQ